MNVRRPHPPAVVMPFVNSYRACVFATGNRRVSSCPFRFTVSVRCEPVWRDAISLSKLSGDVTGLPSMAVIRSDTRKPAYSAGLAATMEPTTSRPLEFVSVRPSEVAPEFPCSVRFHHVSSVFASLSTVVSRPEGMGDNSSACTTLATFKSDANSILAGAGGFSSPNSR